MPVNGKSQPRPINGSVITPMMDGLRFPVLLLNRFYTPVRVATARRALTLLFGGSASAMDERGHLYDFQRWRSLPVRELDDGLPIVGGWLRIPRIVLLTRFDRTPRFDVRLTRRTLMLRDDHQCQYCGRTAGQRDLNIDHVIPRSRGGPDTWENLVTACRNCNLRKGHRTPPEANMRLLRTPTKPRWSPSRHILMSASMSFEEWDPFLG